MNGVQTNFRDRVRYTLYHKKLGSQVITEPIGWNEDEQEYVKHSKYEGILTRLSNSSKYIENGADFINKALETYGIEEEIVLKKEVRHPQTDHWILDYTGVMDLSKWESENFEVKAKFNSSGLETILKARESNKIEIERTTTLDGDDIPELKTEVIELKGKDIFLESSFIEDRSLYVKTEVPGRNGKFYQIKNILPIKVSSKSDELIHSPMVGQFEWNPDSSHIFYGINDREKTLKISINGRIKVNPLKLRNINNREFINIVLFVLKDHNSYNYKERHVIYNDPTPRSGASRIARFNKDFEITLQEGESLAFCIHTGADLGYRIWGYGDFLHEFTDPEIDVLVEEDSSFEKTSTKVVLAHELAERLIYIITGKKDILHSEYLGRKELGYERDGKGALKGYACGHWLRGFDKHPDRKDNKYKPFATSLKDLFNDFMTTENLAIGIEKIGYQEKIVIKPREEFYVNRVTVRLPNQVNVKSKISEKNYFSSVLIGAAKGWDNEEVMGLDEYNTQSIFFTPIKRVKNEYRRITNYIYAPYAGEFIRRKQKFKFPSLDHKNDKEIFAFSLKKEFGEYKLRVWQDDFEIEPKGIYSPETAYNLSYSPANLILKHSKFIASSLIHHRKNFVRFGDSKGNRNLTTKRIGKKEISENNNFLCSDLGTPLFAPIEIEFEHEVSFDIKEILEGSTIIDGKPVRNVNGLIEFINQKGEVTRGYLQSLKPKGKGKWKLIKAFSYDVFRN